MNVYEITRDDIAGIDVRTLVVAGTVSHPALRTAAHTLASWLPDARYLELDCGHVTYAEQPEQFARDRHLRVRRRPLANSAVLTPG